jgi:hypothetical protein
MKHEYRYKLTVLILLFSVCLYAAGNEKMYKKSLEKWNKSGVKEYFIKINFTSFSPMSGVWELNVKEGNIQLCRFNGEPADNYLKAAEMFTMESLYKAAGESICGSKKDPFLVEVIYSKKGVIKSFSKIRNPEYKNKVKTDTSFRIEVLDFIPAGR